MSRNYSDPIGDTIRAAIIFLTLGSAGLAALVSGLAFKFLPVFAGTAHPFMSGLGVGGLTILFYVLSITYMYVSENLLKRRVDSEKALSGATPLRVVGLTVILLATGMVTASGTVGALSTLALSAAVVGLQRFFYRAMLSPRRPNLRNEREEDCCR